MNWLLVIMNKKSQLNTLYKSEILPKCKIFNYIIRITLL